MGSTFVYNMGSAPKASNDVLELEIGLFFDGTLNNKENSRIGIATRAGEASKEEEQIYNKYGKGNRNSYLTDYTNVARMQMYCFEDYAIYIEGIGTVDKQGDEMKGYAFGSGKTGIRAKVRKGCEQLAARLKARKNKDKKLKVLTLDVFGFSRGAAAARNFVYEINGNRREEDDEIKTERVEDGYDNFGSPRFRQIDVDHDGVEVAKDYLKNDKLPRFGYLGYCLLKEGVVSSTEELDSLQISVRFIGLYDTVSSYEEVKDNLIDLATIVLKYFVSNQFQDDVDQLQLNNLGYFTKAVHFTAMDEHREYFDLTRMNPDRPNRVIEKSFPGVHCDIGGAYHNHTDSFPEFVDEIEISWTPFSKKLERRKEELIYQGWYSNEKERQIWIEGVRFGRFYSKLTGKRYLYKEYSYIFLHFMETMFKEVLGNHAKKTIKFRIKDKYALGSSETLLQAQSRLEGYVFRGGDEWKFEESTLNESLEDQNKKEASNSLLKKLRNKFLHWSANRDWIAMDPRDDYNRVEH